MLHPLHWAERSPDRPAWVFPARDITVTYGELASLALRGAHLIRSLGLGVGDGMVVLSANHPMSLAVFWAAQIAGLYYTPISTQFQRREAAHILADCDAQLLITGAGAEDDDRTADAPQPHRFTIDEWLDALSAFPETRIADACEGAEMLYSSGTTGHPKGIRAVRPGAELGTTSELFMRRLALHQIDQNTRYLSTAPLYHSAPLRYNAMTHRNGGFSVIMDRFDAAGSLVLIERFLITHSQWVPTMFVRLLRLPDEVRLAHDLGSHRFAVHAAAPCPAAVKDAMIDWWGPILYEYYSGTEGNGQTAIDTTEWQRHRGSVGRPILGTLKILGDGDEELAPGATGRVFFADGPRFEYYKAPGKTQAAYSSQGYSTLGDIGHIDDDGYLYLTDRESHMIITGGVNVYPREVEDVLLEHPAVQDAAVFGIPDPEFGETIIAAVELSAGRQATETELIGFCRDRIAHLKCPRSIDFHEALPRHATGKLYKQSLIDAYRR